MNHDDNQEAGGSVLSCEDAQERILEADPAELRGEGGGALARHVLGCPDCGARAEWVLAVEGALDATLDARAAAHTRPLEEVLRRVRAGVAAEGASAASGLATGVRSSRPEHRAGEVGGTGGPAGARASGARIRWRVVVPLAAAALAAGLALWRDGPAGSPDPVAPWTVSPAGTGPGAVVEGGPPAANVPSGTEELHVAADRRFALMKTGNPGISVVWFY